MNNAPTSLAQESIFQEPEIQKIYKTYPQLDGSNFDVTRDEFIAYVEVFAMLHEENKRKENK